MHLLCISVLQTVIPISKLSNQGWWRICFTFSKFPPPIHTIHRCHLYRFFIHAVVFLKFLFVSHKAPSLTYMALAVGKPSLLLPSPPEFTIGLHANDLSRCSISLSTFYNSTFLIFWFIYSDSKSEIWFARIMRCHTDDQMPQKCPVNIFRYPAVTW